MHPDLYQIPVHQDPLFDALDRLLTEFLDRPEPATEPTELSMFSANDKNRIDQIKQTVANWPSASEGAIIVNDLLRLVVRLEADALRSQGETHDAVLKALVDKDAEIGQLKKDVGALSAMLVSAESTTAWLVRQVASLCEKQAGKPRIVGTLTNCKLEYPQP